MNRPTLKRVIPTVLLAAGVSGLLAACGGAPAAGGSAAATAQARPTAPLAATSTPLALEPTPAFSLDEGVSGTGTVMSRQDADLVFLSQGTVQEVLVQEGAVVTKGQVLATLDMRLFDQQLHQAEAALASAQAAKSGLSEAPRSYDAVAARAAVQSAQAALAQLQAGPKQQDMTNAQAALNAAQLNLQSTRDRLSQAKTTAELQMNQAVEALTQAQARYAQAKANWDYVNETGRDPVQPDTTNSQTGEKKPNPVTDGQANNYYNTYVQAEAAMRAAEQAVTTAKVAFDTARQQEVTGIQTAEQSVVQAQAGLEKLGLPADRDRVAAAQAQLAAARANQAKLTADPRDSQLAQADAAIAQAQAGLELAQINREHAALVAPFDGVVDVVNVDPGDPSATNGQPAIRVVDISTLHIDAQVSDVDIAKVKVGQQVTVFADALPGQEIQGKVSFISPTAQVVGTIRSYLVRITLDDPKSLRVGMSVRVQIPVK
jgi:HlyD family secretion protein